VQRAREGKQRNSNDLQAVKKCKPVALDKKKIFGFSRKLIAGFRSSDRRTLDREWLSRDDVFAWAHVTCSLCIKKGGKKRYDTPITRLSEISTRGSHARRSEFRERSSADECRRTTSSIRFAADKCNPIDWNLSYLPSRVEPELFSITRIHRATLVTGWWTLPHHRMTRFVFRIAAQSGRSATVTIDHYLIGLIKQNGDSRTVSR